MTAVTTDEACLLGHLNYVEFGRELSRWSGGGGTVHESDGVVLFATSSPFPVLLNGVWRVDGTVPAHEVIATADSYFDTLGRGYSLITRDTDVDAALHDAAMAAGLMPVFSSPEMILRVPVDDIPLADDVELRWVIDRSTFDDFVAVCDTAYASQGLPVGTVKASVTDLAAFTQPHVQSVVAYVDDKPVAVAQTLLSHSIAGVFWVGTLAEARRRGLGEAVTRAVTNRAFDLGARLVSLQASVIGGPLYLRLGYKTLYHYTTFVRFPQNPTA